MGPSLALDDRLVLAPQAAGADLDAARLTIDVDGGSLNIGVPAGLGVTFGVAYVVSRLADLLTDLTSRHGSPLTGLSGLSRILVDSPAETPVSNGAKL